MQYVRLGASGLEVSRLCLGTLTFGSPRWRPWILDEAGARPVFRRAVELGINFFDTADTYSGGESEVVTGRLLAEMFPGARREEAVVATKVFNPVDLAFEGVDHASFRRRPNADGLGRKRIFHAVDASLKRLGVDYIDLYQVHRFDPHTPLEETLEALHDVVKAGKVRYLGASSMWAWQFARLQQLAKERGWTRFASMQNHYNLVYREEEREMIPLCQDSGVALLPWSPLARGFLASTDGAASARAEADETTRKFYGRPSDLQVRDRLRTLAERKGVSPATLAYAWLLHKGVTSPIAGASKALQVEQAVAALDVRLTVEEARELEAPYEARAVLGHS
ncbi:aldo/keto reductase [Ramlibacter monticola]|uniref:Aldo/keto reductase n=1 Tax=Ramlibacter monticola TaxID=1926872 RepID=A0A936Z312_9BURK|nr:aldo/keto reductase [Ramlibacter monticola]MBL0392966.1 aldo/keto reductase [Ramlibacter monticola]